MRGGKAPESTSMSTFLRVRCVSRTLLLKRVNSDSVWFHMCSHERVYRALLPRSTNIVSEQKERTLFAKRLFSAQLRSIWERNTGIAAAVFPKSASFACCRKAGSEFQLDRILLRRFRKKYVVWTLQKRVQETMNTTVTAPIVTTTANSRWVLIVERCHSREESVRPEVFDQRGTLHQWREGWNSWHWKLQL